MNLILVGKGAVLFNIAKLIFNKKKHKILKVFWDKRKNNKSDKYYLKHLRNITVVQTNNINSKKIFIYKKQNFTFLLSINNTQIFNNHFLEIFKNKIINYHYSLIPSYKSCIHVQKFYYVKKNSVNKLALCIKKIDNGKLVYQKFKINKI